MLGSTIILIIGFIILGFAGKSHTLLLLGTILRSIGVGPMFAGIYALLVFMANGKLVFVLKD